jgi:murein DD-endopeptidase MepM/ murein hydrolase activator NlpD
MTEKKWTLLLFGDNPDGVRQFTLSTKVFKVAVGGFAVASLLILSLAVLLVINGAAHLKARRLALENTILSQELAGFQARVDGLEGELARLGEADSRVRLLAGLDATDDEILEVGIGGPGLDVPEAHLLWALDSTLSKAAFAVEYDLNALERRARLLRESLSEASDSLSAHNELLESTPSILPVAGVLSSRFSAARYHPIHHRELPHEGVDISATLGTPILAAAKGIVTFAGWMSGLGYTVEITHGYGYVTRYGHASKLLVQRGQEVIRGEVVAQVGSTGISTSAHLHYEVRIGGKAVNPLNYVIGNVLP